MTTKRRQRKRAYLFVLIASCVFLFVRNPAFGQLLPTVDISGRVVDIKTNTPLHYANVFLSNTTFGSASLQDGSFRIAKVPVGTYTIVVSMMGYELNDREIDLLNPTDTELTFQLQPMILKGETVRVTAPDLKVWRTNLKQFKRQFLGESKIAQQCEIINELMLDFEVDSLSGEFRAFCKEPVKIINHALGYKIDFYIKKFVYLENTYLQYEGRQHFIETTPDSEEQKKRWNKNRQIAYCGSLKHFLTALFNNQLHEEGFFISLDSEMPGRNRAIHSTRAYESDILFEDEFPQLKKISFPQYLKITYHRETEPSEYRKMSVTDNEQNSWFKMTLSDTTTVHETGILSNPLSIQISGYLAWERFGDKLPLNYKPDY